MSTIGYGLPIESTKGRWTRRQATREFASTDEEQYALTVAMSTGRAGLRYLAFVRRGGITVPRGADTTSPDGDRSLKELTVYVSLTHDNAASHQPRSRDEHSHDSGLELPSEATHAEPRMVASPDAKPLEATEGKALRGCAQG